MIRIGTAGWEYPDWYGIVYPRKRSARFDPLAAMSEIFDTIEINSTFYRIPSPRAAESWTRRIASNPAFLFTLKLPRTFTHARVVLPETRSPGSDRKPGPGDGRGGRSVRRRSAARLDESGEEGGRSVAADEQGDGRRRIGRADRAAAPAPFDPDAEERRFRAGIEPLRDAGRLGAVLVQFPQSFHPEPEEQAVLDEILDRFADLPLVVEMRHAGWAKEEAISRIRERGVGFCNIDQPRLSSTLPPTRLVTGPVAYVRLHGRNAGAWFREEAGRDRRYDYLYSTSELAPWVETVRELAGHGSDTFVITNNHFRGKAAVNALQIKAALEGGVVEVPETLFDAYPAALAPIAKPPGGRLPF